MPKKRGSLEIYAAILRVAKTGAKKSHIIYKANLNFTLGQRYLDQLIHAGLLRGPTSRDRAYHTTAKGVAFIKHLESLNALRGKTAPALRLEEIQA